MRKTSKTIRLDFTTRDITLLRCGLLRRVDILKRTRGMRDSYQQSLVLLQRLWDARKQAEKRNG